MSDTPPAGWYPDPQDGARQRYWDGTAWTEHTADGSPQAAGSGTVGAAGAAGARSISTGAEPDTWTWQSIVVTILCCAPFGVAGALNAGRAEQALKSGDAGAATRHAAQAKKWTLWGLGVWAVIAVLYVLFFLVVGAASFSEFQGTNF